jgi:ribosomal protein S18 acetylase RimI-like enzyme
MAALDVLIRRAQERDLPSIGRLGAQLIGLHHSFDRQRFMAPGPDAEGGYARFLGTQLADEDVAVLVAERGDQIAGYVYAAIEPRSWKDLREEAGVIHDVVVDERFRRAGIATALVEAVAAWFGSRGAPRVVLWTAERNEAAHRLFARLGFRRTMAEMTRELASRESG